jgi:drug/metabolite transporter (DMT)-like permease
MRVLNIGIFLLLAALWGGSFLFMRIAAPVLGPVWLIEVRVLIAGLALLPVLIRLNLLGEMRRNAMPVFIVGCINSAMPFLLFAFASLYLPAGFNSILNATSPLFATVVAFVWLKEKLTISRAIGFVVGFVGVVILVGWRVVGVTPSFLMAVAAGLLAALLYAIAAPYAQQKLAGVSPFVTSTGSLLGAAIFLLPFIPFTTPKAVPTTSVILAVLALSLLSTAFAYTLYFRLLENVGSTKALTVAYLIPMFGMLWGAMFLKEPVTESMVFGCGLILLGTAIANDMLAGMLSDRPKF